MVSDIWLRYAQSAEVIWAREERRNTGPWRFLREQIKPLLDGSGRELRYVGRSESASPATGSLKRHQQEQAEILDEALTIGAVARKGKVRLVPRRKAKELSAVSEIAVSSQPSALSRKKLRADCRP